MIKNFLTALLFVLLASCGSSNAPQLAESSADSYNSSDAEGFGTDGAGIDDLLGGLSAPRAAATSARKSEAPTESANTRMVTYSASLDLSVKNTDETKNALVERVKSDDGFVIRETERSVAARVPVGNMDSFIKYAKTLGKIEDETKTGVDITDQYRDNAARLNSLKTVRDRYMALIDQAKTVNEVLSVERELGRVNTEIEMLEGRIKYAEQSVAYSNVTVRFREPVKPGPVGWVFYGLYRGIKWLFVW